MFSGLFDYLKKVWATKVGKAVLFIPAMVAAILIAPFVFLFHPKDRIDDDISLRFLGLVLIVFYYMIVYSIGSSIYAEHSREATSQDVVKLYKKYYAVCVNSHYDKILLEYGKVTIGRLGGETYTRCARLPKPVEVKPVPVPTQQALQVKQELGI